MQLAAQLPEVSTAENPKWYYIQVLGSDTRVGRVFTAEGSKVYGREISASIDPDVTSKQLWRFEKERQWQPTSSSTRAQAYNLTWTTMPPRKLDTPRLPKPPA